MRGNSDIISGAFPDVESGPETGAMSDSLFDQQNAGYVQLLYEEFSKNPD